MSSQMNLVKEGEKTGEPGTSQSPAGLQAGLKNRHLSMIAIGGVIGAGLFVGSSGGIAAAGPAILVSYVLVGALVVFVMRMLGEMAAASPNSGSFSAYADRAPAAGRASPSAGSTGSSGSWCSRSRRRPAR
ncbi:hypothetical protein GCM10023237_45580 [Streptomyces coeruleoprunus]